MRTDANDVAVRLEAMPQNTTSIIKDELRKCAGGRTGRRDFLTLLPSVEEAASVKKVACSIQYGYLCIVHTIDSTNLSGKPTPQRNAESMHLAKDG